MQTRRDLERALLGFIPPEVSPADLSAYLAFKMAAMPKSADTRAFPSDPSAPSARAQLKAAVPVLGETAASFAPGSGEYLSAKSALDNSGRIIPALQEGRYLDALGNAAGMVVDSAATIPGVHALATAGKLAAAKGLPLAIGAIKAFHGTPHTFTPEPGLPFGRFKKEAIGTGEGAAAYGHGASYSAENPAVAGEYWRNLRTPYRYYNANNPNIPHEQLIAEKALSEHGSLDGARLYLNKQISEYDDSMDFIFGDKFINQFKGAIRYLDDIGSSKGQGHLLELSHEWPDAAREAIDPLSKEHLLDWDKPLSEQSERVSDQLKSAQDLPKIRAFLGGMRGTSFVDATSAPYFSGSDLYHELKASLGSDKAASEYLHSLGIPGIKYLDGSSRGTGEGTHNFVMFEPDYTKIVARDGVPVEQAPEVLKVNI